MKPSTSSDLGELFEALPFDRLRVVGASYNTYFDKSVLRATLASCAST